MFEEEFNDFIDNITIEEVSTTNDATKAVQDIIYTQKTIKGVIESNSQDLGQDITLGLRNKVGGIKVYTSHNLDIGTMVLHNGNKYRIDNQITHTKLIQHYEYDCNIV